MSDHLLPWRTAIGAALAIAATNLIVLAGGRLLGADMVVAWSVDAPPVQVGIASVVLMSVVPALLGGVVLWLARRSGVRAWHGLGWLGVAVGVVTVAMPLSVVATAATTATLVSMHVVAGLIWLTVVRRAAARKYQPAPVFGHA